MKVIGRCAKCGHLLTEDKPFCPRCGVTVQGRAPSHPSQQPSQPQGDAGQEVRVIRSSGVAALLSFFIPGAGQIYCQEYAKGIFMFVGYTITVGFGVGALSMEGVELLGLGMLAWAVVLWVDAIFDAGRVADRLNCGGQPHPGIPFIFAIAYGLVFVAILIIQVWAFLFWRAFPRGF